MKFYKRFKIAALMVMSFFLLVTCSTSKKTSKTSGMFRIPQKVVKAEDLPEHLREETTKTERVIQLFPEEATETIVEEPKEEPIAVVKEDPIDKVVEPFIYVPKEQRYYHIVSGSFLTKLYAEIFVTSLQGMGYANTYMKFADNGFYRVIVQKYPNEVEARQYLQGYRDDNPQYASAWLYYKRNGNGQTAFNQYY